MGDQRQAGDVGADHEASGPHGPHGKVRKANVVEDNPEPNGNSGVMGLVVYQR